MNTSKPQTSSCQICQGHSACVLFVLGGKKKLFNKILLILDMFLKKKKKKLIGKNNSIEMRLLHEKIHEIA